MQNPSDDIRAWPTSPQAFADVHACPGCFTEITVPLCPVCGFVVTDPRAREVLSFGREILALETARRRVIDDVRLTYRQAPVETPAPAPAPMPVPVPAPVLVPVREFARPVEPVMASTAAEDAAPQPLASAFPVPRPVAPTPPRPPRRRLSVPVLLLIVGVSLVGVAAIFFLVYAWFAWGILVRALIIGAITVATIAISSILRRRSLDATAEGIAVLGIVLLGLDAWALRANDFFGASQVPGALYAGIGVVAVGVLCRVWAKLSGLRSPDIAAVIALPVGIGLLVGGMTSLPVEEAVVAGLLGAAAGGLIHALPAPWSSARARADSVPERTTLAVLGVAALVAAAIIAALTSLESIWAPVWSGLAIVVLGALHAWLLRSRHGESLLPATGPIAAVASGVAAAVATLFGWQLALRTDLPVYTLLLGPFVAVAVPVVIDRLHQRVTGLNAARITAAALGVVSLVVTLVFWATLAARAISTSWIAWETPAFFVPPGQADGAPFAAVAGALMAVLLMFAPSLTTLSPRAHSLRASTPHAPAPNTALLRNVRVIVMMLLVLVGASVPAVPGVLVTVASLGAAAATALLMRDALRPGAGVAAALAALTAFTAGIASPWLWAIGLLVALGVPIAAHALTRPTGPAGAGLVFAPIGVAAISAFIAPAALVAATGATQHPSAAFVLIQWVAVLATAGAVLFRGDALSRTTLAVSGFVLVLFSLLPYLNSALGIGYFDVNSSGSILEVIGEPTSAVVRAAALLVMFAFIALGRTRVDPAPSLGAAALIAPLAALAAFVVLQVLGLDDSPALPVATVTAAVSVVGVAAVWSMLRPQAAPQRTTRLVVDLSAATVALALAWGITAELAWLMLLLIGAGFAAASVTPGWAAPATSRADGVPSTRSVGVSTATAPRRLLVWPAFALATAALWSGLAMSPDPSSLSVEIYLIPPAIGLLLFTALLIWLRRHSEAAVAIGASFTLGLVLLAAAGWFAAPLRSTVVAIVASVLCLLLTCTPAIRARIPALTGAFVALVAVAFVTLERAVTDSPMGTLWLVLLVAVAVGSALGVSRHARSAQDAPVPYAPARASWYSAIVPPLAIIASTGAGLASADTAAVVAVALGVLAALHVASAAVGRDPFGPATRWTTLAGLGAFAVATVAAGTVDIDGMPMVELMSLPVALVVLAGSALAQWRQHRRGEAASPLERGVWFAGLVIIVLPSIMAPVSPLRVWLGVAVPLVAALAAVILPSRRSHGLRAPSALILTGASLLMGARTLIALVTDGWLAYAEPVALVAGVGGLLVAAAMVWTGVSVQSPTPTEGSPAEGPPAEESPARATPWSAVIAAVATVLLLVTIIVFSDGDLARSTLTAIVAAAAAVAGASLLGSERWRVFGAIVAVGGLIGALVAVGARFVVVLNTVGSSIESDVWALIGLGITAAVGVAALRATAETTNRALASTVVGVVFAAALALFTVAELALLGSSDTDALRTLFVMSALTIAGVGGVLLVPRLGRVLPIAAAAAAGLFGVLALLAYGVAPVEFVTVPPALGLLALGVRTLRRTPAARTWPTLGPGLGLLLVPSLLFDFGATELWRVVALGVIAIALVVVGAVRRLQAPLVLGSVVVLIHGIAQLWPWIGETYVYVPWWLWLGIGGALLIYLAARYEKQKRALRTAFTAVTSLR